MAGLDKIVDSGLCLGCGLCSAVARRGIMGLSPEGFLVPSLDELSTEEKKTVSRICPSVNMRSSSQRLSLWGPVKKCYEAWASDPKVRFGASSGGVVSALACYLLETKQVDGILHVRSDGLYKNELQVSRSREEVISNSSSRYAPASVFDRFMEIMESADERFCFIGKPCDLAALSNFEKAYPQYAGRVRLRISIFCAGVPSLGASKGLVNSLRPSSAPVHLQYRGNGWPGEFSARYADDEVRSVSYEDSWGKVLGKSLGLRCKVCPDGTGYLADISTGDAWKTHNGYPDFSDRDGVNFVLVRTDEGARALEGAHENGDIEMTESELSCLKEMQPSQFQKSMRSPWRLLGVRLATGVNFNFRGFHLSGRAFKLSFLTGVRECLGTIRRCITIRRGKRS